MTHRAVRGCTRAAASGVPGGCYTGYPADARIEAYFMEFNRLIGSYGRLTGIYLRIDQFSGLAPGLASGLAPGLASGLAPGLA